MFRQQWNTYQKVQQHSIYPLNIGTVRSSAPVPWPAPVPYVCCCETTHWRHWPHPLSQQGFIVRNYAVTHSTRLIPGFLSDMPAFLF